MFHDIIETFLHIVMLQEIQQQVLASNKVASVYSINTCTKQVAIYYQEF